MENKRTEQINELIKRELGSILNKELEVPDGSLITILKIETTSDLKQAKIWVSIFPFSKAEEVFSDLSKKRGYFRGILGKRFKRLKTVPKLNFVLDQTGKEIDDLDKALNNF